MLDIEPQVLLKPEVSRVDARTRSQWRGSAPHPARTVSALDPHSGALPRNPGQGPAAAPAIPGRCVPPPYRGRHAGEWVWAPGWGGPGSGLFSARVRLVSGRLSE